MKAEPDAVAATIDRMAAEGKISVAQDGKLVFIG